MQPQGMRALALPDSSSSSTATYLTAVLIIFASSSPRRTVPLGPCDRSVRRS
jgi:hypothetical protein